MIRTTDFAALTDDLQEITSETMMGRVAEMSVADMLFDIKDVVRKTYDLRILHGTAGIEHVAEGSDFPRVTNEQGDGITFTQAQYGAIVPITKQMRMFDLYDEIKDLATSVAEDGMDKIDQSLADVLLNGFATTAYTDVYGQSVTPTGPNGLSLFSSVQSNGATATTFSNLINDGVNNNPAISREAIRNERVRGLTYADVNGLIRPVRLDTVIVAPSGEDAAERFLDSPQIPGEANNDINALKGKIKQLKVWERLETRGSDATDTSAYWFMADSSQVKKCLKAIFAQRPQLSAPEVIFQNKDWEYSFDYLYLRGFGWASALRGSTGVN